METPSVLLFDEETTGPGAQVHEGGRALTQTSTAEAFTRVVPALLTGRARATFSFAFEPSSDHWVDAVGVFPCDTPPGSSASTRTSEHSLVITVRSFLSEHIALVESGGRVLETYEGHWWHGDSVELDIVFENAATAHVTGG